ncbi:MAG: hypothetical protein MMC33_004509 [Icmadophila ericetorum]|nr:hypothetical protein [Icmadophila ericetorum]
MSAILQMTSPNPLKRPYEATEVETQSHYDDQSENRPEKLPSQSELQEHSPTRTSVAVPTSDGSLAASRATSPLQSTTPFTTTIGSPLKKRKLTASEKKTRRMEKEQKDQLKAAEKAKKEEEKRIKDEEKKAKEELQKQEKKKREDDKEEKRKAKEAENKAKEEKKRKEDEEKARKERSQLRLGSFFTKPQQSLAGLVGSPARDRDALMSSRRNSIVSVDEVASAISSRSVSVAPEELTNIEYERAFPSFFLQSHTTLAPVNRHRRPIGVGIDVNDVMDSAMLNGVNTAEALGEMIARMLSGCGNVPHGNRARRVVSVKDIIDRLHGPWNYPIDLTDQAQHSTTNPLELLCSTPLKYLRYAEDVRPPYIGTYSKLPVGHTVSKLCRNPFTRSLPAVNYDYDSEMEWQEPEEGEYLGSEDEEDEAEDDEGEDLEGFLDDEEAGADTKVNKPKHVMGDLEPMNTGLCWSSKNSRTELVVPYGKDTLNLNNFRLDVLLANPTLPIDPHSTSYWSPITPTKTSAAQMPPPSRIPLTGLKTANTLSTPSDPLSKGSNFLKLSSSQASASSSAPTKSVKTNVKKPLPPDQLEDFRKAVQGSDLTKAGLVEVLKKQFPKAGKETIKATLEQIADRVGGKEADKRWKLKDEVVGAQAGSS